MTIYMVVTIIITNTVNIFLCVWYFHTKKLVEVLC